MMVYSKLAQRLFNLEQVQLELNVRHPVGSPIIVYEIDLINGGPETDDDRNLHIYRSKDRDLVQKVFEDMLNAYNEGQRTFVLDRGEYVQVQ